MAGSYTGILQQQRVNVFKSILLLLLFPCIMAGVAFAAVFLIVEGDAQMKVEYALSVLPFVGIAVLIWFLIAYFANTAIINGTTGAKPLERKDNPRIYNLVENLCISCGMKMPAVNIIETDGLNAYASGINEKTYAVTLTRGIINKLDDDELSGVIAHELSHIRNKDTQLLIISIVFVGIMSVLMRLSLRLSYDMSHSRRNSKNGKSDAVVMLIIFVCAAIGYFFTLLTRFAISRKREFLADAAGAELCKNPMALASALRKISGDPGLENVEREDVAQLFIFRAKPEKDSLRSMMASAFATHPDIKLRIKYLEEF